MADGCLEGITGNGPDDVWIYGEASFVAGSCFGLRVYHYDGRTMKDRTEEVSLAGVGFLNRIVSAGDGSAWMLGSLGTIRWDGARFSRLPALLDVKDAWAASSKDVWFVSDRIHHWDGSQLEIVTSSSPAGGFSVISGSKSGDFWVGASNEGLLRSRRPLVSPR